MEETDKFEHLIDRLVTVQNLSGREDSIGLKIDLLGLMLQKLRHARRQQEEQITFEEFEQCHLFADTQRLVVTGPGQFKDIGTGTEPIRLQAPLLLFLLLNHRERRKILEIIKLFTEKIRGDLKFLDFKKTKTGVTRCFTNTRFAAHTLRDYGLLKFSQKEAFKTWELSLVGFMVAAKLLRAKQRPESTWQIPTHQKTANFELLPEIRFAYDGIYSYEEFVKLLAEVCKPDASVFKTFESALGCAHALLPIYWKTLKDETLTQSQRRHASLELIKQLEREGINDEFYAELSACIKINDLLGSATG